MNEPKPYHKPYQLYIGNICNGRVSSHAVNGGVRVGVP
nr:MAG TPA: hypothetical protein [Caudoviricetes sp.]